MDNMRNRASYVGSFFIVVFVLLLIIVFIRNLFGSDTPFTFSSFFEILTNAPSFDTSFIDKLSLTGDWGIFNFLRQFLDSILAIVRVLLFICVQIGNLFAYVGYFSYNLFGFSLGF